MREGETTRSAMYDPRKGLPYAPYIMFMIEKVSKITFPKDVIHEPLRLRVHPENPHGSIAGHHNGIQRDTSNSDAPSSSHGSRHDSDNSFIKRALKSIFGICKHMATKVNENRRGLIEIKRHLNLPCDTYHELPRFDDPFASIAWDNLEPLFPLPRLLQALLVLAALVLVRLWKKRRKLKKRKIWAVPKKRRKKFL